MATYNGTAGNDTLTGSNRDDSITGGAGHDVAYGGDGADELFGDSGNDSLYGGSGSDGISGGLGNDLLDGGTGSDILVGGQGGDSIYGGTGNDEIVGDGQWISLANLASKSGGTSTTLTVTNNADGPITLKWVDSTGTAQVVTTIAAGGTHSFSTLTSNNYVLTDPEGYFLEPILGAANQTVAYSPPFGDLLYGGDSDDTILGQYGDDTLYGDAGKDTLRGGTGNDVLYGGAGNDSLDGDEGNDLVYGGDGNDIVHLGQGDDTFGDWSLDGGDDLIDGGAGNDYIIGGAGNDTVYGGDGDDSLSGAIGNDTLYGGAGSDLFAITDDHQGDTIYGGENAGDFDQINFWNYLTSQGVVVTYSGNEAGSYDFIGTDGFGVFSEIEGVFGTGFADTVNAAATTTGTYIGSGAGNDLVTGGSGNDTINAGADADTVYGGAGNDLVDGEAGNDLIDGGSGNDTLQGGTGNDTLLGGSGADSLTGGSGDDSLDGGADNDTLVLDDGNDTALGGDGDDSLYGGQGNDRLYGDAGWDSLYGGAGNDTLFGGDGGDQLQGGLGNDSLEGGTGSDVFQIAQGDGTDIIVGGENLGDYDTLTFSGAAAGVTVQFTGAEAGTYTLSGAQGSFSQIEAVQGTAFGDTLDASANTAATGLSAGAGDDLVRGGSGADHVSSGDGNDTAYGGAGNDTLNGDQGNDLLYGDDGNDWLLTGNGDDRAFGGTGDDYLSDMSGNSYLDGGAGNDTIYGGGGADTLIGGSGNDVMTGGTDRDLFILTEAGGGDTITDFDVALSGGITGDRLDVSDLQNPDASPVRAWDVTIASDGSGGTLLTFPEGETLRLSGVDPVTVAQPGMLAAMGVPCFARGTRIQTPQGLRPIEQIAVGDLVSLADGGALPVLWAGQRDISPLDLAQNGRLRPVCIRAGCHGALRDLLLSPQHAVEVTAKDGRRALVRAKHLARIGWHARAAFGLYRIHYHHLLLPRHAMILAEGVRVESLYPGPMALMAFAAADRAAIKAAVMANSAPGCSVIQVYGPRALPLLTYAGVREWPWSARPLRPTDSPENGISWYQRNAPVSADLHSPRIWPCAKNDHSAI